jgi:hypothetical protein
MIGLRDLEDALSRHLARTITNMAAGQNAMAVDGADQGVDLKAAAALGARYHENYLAGMGPGDAAAAAFAAGVITGLTAVESEVRAEEAA